MFVERAMTVIILTPPSPFGDDARVPPDSNQILQASRDIDPVHIESKQPSVLQLDMSFSG